MKILAALAGADRVGFGEAQKGGTGHAGRGIRFPLYMLYLCRYIDWYILKGKPKCKLECR